MEKGIKVLSPELFKSGENWEDFYVELKELRKGDVFYECSPRSSENYELKAIEDAKKTRNGWMCKVETSDKKIVDFYVSANTTYTGPNLFMSPQNLTQLDNGKYVYIIK